METQLEKAITKLNEAIAQYRARKIDYVTVRQMHIDILYRSRGYTHSDNGLFDNLYEFSDGTKIYYNDFISEWEIEE